MFKFELYPHICKIHTDILVYESCGGNKKISKHLEESKLRFLICNKMKCVMMWKSAKYIFFLNGMTFVWLSLPSSHNLEYQYNKGKNSFYKKCSSTSSQTFLIIRESEDEQRPVSVSAHHPPKIR